MGLFKADFYRFFTFGFAAGALLVVATMEAELGSIVAQGVAPTAQAQALEAN